MKNKATSNISAAEAGADSQPRTLNAERASTTPCIVTHKEDILEPTGARRGSNHAKTPVIPDDEAIRHQKSPEFRLIPLNSGFFLTGGRGCNEVLAFDVQRSTFSVRHFPIINPIPPLDTPLFTGILSRSVGNWVFFQSPGRRGGATMI
jgi:hypothetical protein